MSQVPSTSTGIIERPRRIKMSDHFKRIAENRREKSTERSYREEAEDIERRNAEGEDYLDKSRYMEYHDGAMWQFMVNRINRGSDPLSYGIRLWQQFRPKRDNQVIEGKSPNEYADRCRLILVPNLHIMPFDNAAKAALYQSLEYPVPLEFRKELITSTGVRLSESGLVEDYPERPFQIVLHPGHHPSLIGITSTIAYSTLRAPGDAPHVEQNYRKPWTAKEDREILQYVRNKSIDEHGRLHQITVPRTVMSNFWGRFEGELRTTRGLKPVAARFQQLREDIIYLNSIDIKLKLELYYILSKPLDAFANELFKSIVILITNKNSVIRFAVGSDFLLGRMDLEQFEVNRHTFHYDNAVLIRIVGYWGGGPYRLETNFNKLHCVTGRVLAHIHDVERKEREALGLNTNSSMFPYYDRNQIICRPAAGQKLPYSEMPVEKSTVSTVEMEDCKPEINLEVKKEEEDTVVDDKDFLEGPSSHPKDPLLMTPMDHMDNAFREAKMHIKRFHDELNWASKTMSDQKRLQCLTEIEQLTRMFRMTGKTALTPPGPPSKKKK